MRIIASLGCLLLMLALTTHAADPRKAPRSTPPAVAQPAPPPPPPPEGATSDPTAEELEPEVTITTKGTEIHEEYRLNGVLYMVKVKPAKGPPYYLVYDERGNSRRSDLEPETVVPVWVIKRF